VHWQAEFDDMADGRPDVFVKQGWDMREGWEPSLRLKSEMGKNILLRSYPVWCATCKCGKGLQGMATLLIFSQ
jgi:hypothetical protein